VSGVGGELVHLGLILLVDWACLDSQGEVSSFGWIEKKKKKKHKVNFDHSTFVVI